MPRTFTRALAVLLAVPLTPACTQANPFFLPASGGDGGTNAGTTSTAAPPDPTEIVPDPGTSLDSPTSTTDIDPIDPGTSGTTSVDPIDTSATSGASTTSEDTSTTGADSSTGAETSTTGDDPGEPPEPVTVTASLATCVLRPQNLFQTYIGPGGCEVRAENADGLGQTGVMILDTAFANGGGGRRAEIYLRFEIPDTLAGKKLTSATLSLQVSPSPDAGGPGSGVLHRTGAFDGWALAFGVPQLLDLLAGDPGASMPGQPTTWNIPLADIMPAQPLFLGLLPTSPDGILFHSSRAPAPLRPKLMITHS